MKKLFVLFIIALFLVSVGVVGVSAQQSKQEIKEITNSCAACGEQLANKTILYGYCVGEDGRIIQTRVVGGFTGKVEARRFYWSKLDPLPPIDDQPIGCFGDFKFGELSEDRKRIRFSSGVLINTSTCEPVFREQEKYDSTSGKYIPTGNKIPVSLISEEPPRLGETEFEAYTYETPCQKGDFMLGDSSGKEIGYGLTSGSDALATKIFPGKVGTEDDKDRELTKTSDDNSGILAAWFSSITITNPDGSQTVIGRQIVSYTEASKGPLWVLIENGLKSEDGVIKYIATVGKRVADELYNAIVRERANVNLVGESNNNLMFTSNVPVYAMFESEGKKRLGTEGGLLASQVSELDPEKNGVLTFYVYETGNKVESDVFKACTKIKSKDKASISSNGVITFSGKEKSSTAFLAIQNKKSKQVYYSQYSKGGKVRINGDSNIIGFTGPFCYEIEKKKSSGGGGSSGGSSGGDSQPSIPFPGGDESGGISGGDDGSVVITYTYGTSTMNGNTIEVIPAVMESPNGDVAVAVISKNGEIDNVYLREDVQGEYSEVFDGTLTVLIMTKWEVGPGSKGGSSLYTKDAKYYPPFVDSLKSQGINEIQIGLKLLNKEKVQIGVATLTIDLNKLGNYEIPIESSSVAQNLNGVSVDWSKTSPELIALYEGSSSSGASVSGGEEPDFSIYYTPPSGEELAANKDTP